MQSIGNYLSSALTRALSNDIHPTNSLLNERFIFASATASMGGIAGSSILNTFSHEFMPVSSGAIFGVSLALINTITSMACKALDIKLVAHGFRSMLKTILDIGLAVFATYALSNLFSIQLTATKAYCLIPTTILGIATVLVGANTLVYCAKHLDYFISNMETAIWDMSKY